MDQNMENFGKVLEDKEFVQQLFAADDVTDVQKMLEERGVELTVDQIESLGDLLIKMESGEIKPETLQSFSEGELSDDDLEEVAGGFGELGLVIGQIAENLPKIAGAVAGTALLVGGTIYACVKRRGW